MNFRNLLFQQPYNIRKQVRNIETNEKKLIQAKMAVVFNNTCIYIYVCVCVKNSKYICVKRPSPSTHPCEHLWLPGVYMIFKAHWEAHGDMVYVLRCQH